MKILKPAALEAELAFARKATDHFATHPQHYTFTDGDIAPAALLAIRWGADITKPNAVVVLRVGEQEPVIYGDMDHDRAARIEAANYTTAMPAQGDPLATVAMEVPF